MRQRIGFYIIGVLAILVFILSGCRSSATGSGATVTKTITKTVTVSSQTTSSQGGQTQTQSTTTQTQSTTTTDASLPLKIIESSLPEGTYGMYYGGMLAATGGMGSYTWSISAGELPAGLSLDSSTGIIKGTPTDFGTFTFTVKVKDQSATVKTASQGFTIEIEAGDVEITTTSLSSGMRGESYSATLIADNGSGEYTWSLSSGTLPTGLTLSSTAGTLKGTPTKYGNYTFNITVKDKVTGRTDTQSYTVFIDVEAVEITTTSLDGGTTGEYYSETLETDGGTDDFTWSKYSGTLPTGLTLSSTAGTIKGTPTKYGTYTFVIEVTDNEAGDSDTQSYNVVIEAGEVEIVTTSLDDGTTGEYYSETLETEGGSGDFTWSRYSGTLPSGLSLSSSSGTIRGTPTAVGEYTFTIKVTDDETGDTDRQSYTVTIEAGEVEIITTSLEDGTTGEYYSETLEAAYGSGDYTWSRYSGILPTGLSLSSSTGILRGTPTVSGDFTFTIKVTDDYTDETDTQSYTVTIEVGELVISTSSLPDGDVGDGYSATLRASGGSGDFTWSLYNGSLPDGLALNSSTGKITGTPTDAGDYSFTIQVEDEATLEIDRETFTITIS